MWGLDTVKAHLTMAVLDVNTIEKQHMEMHIEIQRRTEALYECHGYGLRGGLGGGFPDQLR